MLFLYIYIYIVLLKHFFLSDFFQALPLFSHECKKNIIDVIVDMKLWLLRKPNAVFKDKKIINTQSTKVRENHNANIQHSIGNSVGN